jgi:hypothetical protein
MPRIKIAGINASSLKKDYDSLKENINKLCFDKALVKLYYKHFPNIHANISRVIKQLKNNPEFLVKLFLYKEIKSVYNNKIKNTRIVTSNCPIKNEGIVILYI